MPAADRFPSVIARLAFASVFCLPWDAVVAAQVPVPTVHDQRVRYVNYNKDDVTVILVQRGTATRIVLADDEKILRDSSATGFAADCSRPELEWCIRADAGSNQVLVKPKEGASHNNLELKTDQRDYSFSFTVLPDARQAQGSAGRPRSASAAVPMYRVSFRYPALAAAQPGAAPDPATERARLAARLATSRPAPRNWHYSVQAAKGSHDIVPALVFDDGRFTYFRFPANREIPAIFFISPTGEETRVNSHMNAHDPAIAVVERLGRRFVLRLGNAAVGIWNEAFDPEGVAARDGTTVDGVARHLRRGSQP
ncbi:MAG: TrbG/VirB9 family P-type conjugative transfer protein [Pseudomonadota bacterium]